MMQFRVSELIDKIAENRDSHRVTFEKALEGWQRACVKRLDEMKQEALDGRNIDMYVNLPRPEDHTADYDRVLAMLSMTSDEEITLNAPDFAQFVLDDWGWKRKFLETTASYIGENSSL